MPVGRKRRTKAHVRADIALKYVQWICARAGFTTSDTPQGADYGIDLSMQTFDRAGEVESEEVRFQVKAASRLRFAKAGSMIAYTVDKRDLRNWLEQIFPVILVVFDARTMTAYWVYVQRYFGHRSAFLLKTKASSRTIHLDKSDELNVLSVRRFARWKNAIARQVRKIKLHV
jgi:hypothetical protein